MGLTRLFVIPEGATADEGAYLAFPERDLFGQLALESARARCLVVGEDLGTVPENFRSLMDAADILSYRVLSFERDGQQLNRLGLSGKIGFLHNHPRSPGIAGWWQGEDIREKEALGLIPAEAADAARTERAFARQALLHVLGLDFDVAPDGLTRSAYRCRGA